MLRRVTERRGLHDTDGNVLPDDVVRAAWYGSAVDGDVCHLSARDMLSNMCTHSIVKMVREFDLERGVWSTNPYDECGRYADDILSDWRAHGIGAYESLHDTVSAYAMEINACAKPERRFGGADFVYTQEHGTVPKAIPAPKRPAPYRLGEGHTAAPDGVGHPLMEHLARRTPPGLLPRDASRCARPLEHPAKTISPAVPRRPAVQPAKEESIRNMVESLRPDAAYMLERNGRHDVVMRGGVDPAEAIGLADAIGRRHGTPVGCMTLRSAALLRDPSGNDAKLVAARGVALAGDMSVGGPVRAPRPADVAAARMVWNLDRLGFPMCVREEPGLQPILRPEYVVAASQFHREARWFLSGTAVLLRRPDIDWDLMTYLARTYRFVGLARGILEALGGIDGDGAYREPLSMLGAGRPVLNEGDMREALRFCVPNGRWRARLDATGKPA